MVLRINTYILKGCNFDSYLKYFFRLPIQHIFIGPGLNIGYLTVSKIDMVPAFYI